LAQPAAFIDRDGTLIEDADFLTSADGIRFLPGAVPALKRLHEAGYAVVIITNQSGIARGLLTETDLAAIHDALIRQVEMMGGHIDAIYHCPHLPPEHADADDPGNVRRYVTECDCRKPRPGMFLRARDELDLDLDASFAVGDAWRDVEAALGAGVPSVKVPRPASRGERPRPELPLLGEAATLAEAVEIILNTSPEEARDTVRQARRTAVAKTRNVGSKTMAKRSHHKKKPAPEAKLDFETPDAPMAETAADDTAEPEFDASLASSPVLGQLDAGDAADEPAEDEAEPSDVDEELDEEEEDEEDVEVDEEAFAEALRDEDDLEEEEVEEEDEDASVCGRCGAEIDEADVTSGAAGEVHDVLLCRECFPEVSRMSERAARHTGERGQAAGTAAPGNTPATLEAILGELRAQSARQQSVDGGLDLARVVAMVAQTFAVILAAMAPMLIDKAPVWLLAAIFVQLLALTMFTISRKRN
jgi:D-glycero-D-manno-heptose 1,7-bisphosphate phosphatase